jgi:hypothetical protein
MKLPLQAPAVVRGGFSWPPRRAAHLGGAVAAVEPAGQGVITCTGTTPVACICDNGIATCCPTGCTGCTTDPSTGACGCDKGKP